MFIQEFETSNTTEGHFTVTANLNNVPVRHRISMTLIDEFPHDAFVARLPKHSIRFALIIFSLCIAGCGGKSASPDFTFIDGHLRTWDRFAQGANELSPQLKRDTPQFEKELAQVLQQGDRRAPSRLVFYAVVQVGGFIASDSDLGRACERLVGNEVPIFTSEQGERSYFAGDLYFWWQRHRAEFESFPLYDQWAEREFVKKTVIPMYESATRKR